MTAPDVAMLTAWLDSMQAEVERDHRPNAGITRTSCYCDCPEPCEDRIDQLAVIEELRAILTRSAELVAENMRIHRELDAALDGNQRLQMMNEGLRQMAIQAREAAEGWHRATIDLYSGREEPHPADCACGRQESCMPQRPTSEASELPAIAPCCGGPHAGWIHAADCRDPQQPSADLAARDDREAGR